MLSEEIGQRLDDSAASLPDTHETENSSVAEWFSAQREPIRALIHSRLMEMIYSNGSYLRLSLIKRVAVEEVDEFCRFISSRDASAVQAFGARRAKEGMSASVLLAIFRCMSEHYQENLTNTQLVEAAQVSSLYTSIYLESYLTSRESLILAEQEHIRSALHGSFNRYYLWLQTAADISKAVTSTLDLRQLITEAVNLIRTHFDHYHVALYLLDNSRKYAVLRASSGRDNHQIGRAGQKVRVDNRTMVGLCALQGEAKTVTNINIESPRKDLWLLPESKSVMLLPLISRRLTVGVITIQSTQPSAFYDDDIQRMQTVADQLANAIENARLYYELQIHSQNLAQAVEIRTLELEKTTKRVEAILRNSPDAILLLGKNLNVELANPAAYKMFGYDADDIAAVSLRDLIVSVNDLTLQDILDDCAVNRQSRTFDIVARRQDDSTFDAGIALASVYEDNMVTGLVCILRDITEQVKAEDQIKSSLREKEVLLQEIHHRVKNNLQVISSLIALQSEYTDDNQVHQMFRESQNRIRSMALVHEQLYRSRDLARIDFSKYIMDLTSNLIQSYQKSLGRIKLDVHADPIYLDIDTAIPCGLIINELVSNALKHAFPGDRSGMISVEFYSTQDHTLTLIVRDDGVGFPETLNVYKTESLGLQLVTSLSAQLNATIGLLKVGGTNFEIRFAAQYLLKTETQ